MKKCYLLSALLTCFALFSNGQITITQNDMPHPGDTTRLTSAQINLFLNYTATGPNHTWDFSDLRTNTQLLDSPMSVSATNFIYALYYSNFPFNTNRATVAYQGVDQAVNPLIPLTNPYGFFYLNSSIYKQVGLGAELLNFPTPIAFNSDDIIYNLPLNYGDADTSQSDWGLGLADLAYLGYTQTRTNQVDGWGTLITPHGTYDVLRVKTTRVQKDTLSIDSLGLNFAIDRPVLKEYKWLANGETVPVLQVNTQTVFGFEIITEILFIDDFLRIETNALASNVICAGSTITVPYTKYGSFNPQNLFNQGNRFRAQLSDSSGSFVNPINIGIVNSTASGVITATIPATILAGTHYRIRVVSTDPAVTGSDNGIDITIEYPAVANISANGPLVFCQPGQVELLADSASGYSYQWYLNSAAINGATLPGYLAVQSGSYTVDVSNSCGTVNSTVINVMTNPAPTITLTGNLFPEICPGELLTIHALVTDALTMQWQLNNAAIPGETNDSLVLSQTGIYFLVATNNCGSVTSAAITVIPGQLPTVNVNPPASLNICPGDTILLTTSATGAVSYQWQLNGSDITGETSDAYMVLQPGTYTVVVTNNCGTTAATPVIVSPGLLPAATVNNSAQAICEGDSILITATATNATNLQWQLNGSNIAGAVDSFYYATATGTYTVTVSNACGNVTSNGAGITVNPLPAEPIITFGLDTLFTVPAFSYQWFLSGNIIAGATGPYYVPQQNGLYTVLVTDSNGCSIISKSFDLVNLGIAVAYESNIVTVYPNPVENLLNLHFKNHQQVSGFKIYDMLGQECMNITVQMNTGNQQINTSSLRSGYYTLQVKMNGNIFNYPIIKN